MGSRNRLLYLRLLFNIGLIFAAVYITQLSSRWQAVAIILLVVIASVIVWRQHVETLIQPASKSLQAVLEDEILPRVHNKCTTHSSADPTTIRVNIMLKRRRGLNPFRNEFWVWPWQRTLQIEAAYSPEEAEDYEMEASLEWTRQGVVGDAADTRAQESWTRPDYPDFDPREMWGLTDKQHLATKRVNSVLSVPIYLPDDKTNPIGVVNFDSVDSISESELNNEAFREEAIYWANVIGAIVD